MIFYLITLIYGCNSLHLKSIRTRLDANNVIVNTTERGALHLKSIRTRLDANNVIVNTTERGGHYTPGICSWDTLYKNEPDGYVAAHCGYWDGGILGGTTDSLTECVQICENTVDCIAFSYDQADGGQCYTYNYDTKWYYNPVEKKYGAWVNNWDDIPTSFAYKKNVGVVCNDFPGWEDDDGWGCSMYTDKDYCYMEIQANWDKSGPYYGAYPDQSCCFCHGGQRRRTGAPTQPTTPEEEEEETQAPTTQAPTTQAPTTQAPTTQAPTTQAPTTKAPTTQPPTTQPASQEHDDTPVEVPFGHNCNCGARIEKFKSGKGNWELCHEACFANDDCKSFGVWTKRQKGLCVLFDTVCTDPCPKPTKTNHRYLNDVYNMKDTVDMPCANGDISLDSGGESRKFEFYKPSSASKSSPIIFVWHGFSANPSLVEDKIKMKPEADKKGWVLVYPYGTGFPASFNGMGCCNVNGPDDVQYAKDVINYLENNECGNANLVFTTGFSNGGFMTNRLGCEAGNRNDGTPWFKGIAPHSALIGDYFASSLPDIDHYTGCNPSIAVPIISFFGTADNVVGYDGTNPNPLSSAKWYSFEDSMSHWRNLHRCDDSKDVMTTPVAGKKTFCRTNRDCEVSYCSIDGLAHDWTRHDNLDATSMIVDFFEKTIEKTTEKTTFSDEDLES